MGRPKKIKENNIETLQEKIIIKDSIKENNIEILQEEIIIEESFQIENKKELSKGAKGWFEYLKRNRITPEEWLKKYPTNKFRHQVEEIIEYNKNRK